MAKLLSREEMLEKAKTHKPVFITKSPIYPRGNIWALAASADGDFYARTFYGDDYDGCYYQKYVNGWVAWSDVPSDEEYKNVKWNDNRQ